MRGRGRQAGSEAERGPGAGPAGRSRGRCQLGAELEGGGAGRGRGGAGPEREPSSCPGYPPPTTQGRVPRIAPRRHRQETRKGSLWPWWIKAARELLPPDPGHLKPHPEVLSLARPRAGPAKGQRETAVRRPRPDHRLAAPRPGPIQRCGCTRAAGKEGRGGSRPGEGAPPRAAGPDPAASSRAHARTGALGVEATLSTCARALGSPGWVAVVGSPSGRALSAAGRARVGTRSSRSISAPRAGPGAVCGILREEWGCRGSV